MRSKLPKVLHQIGGRPMLGHTLATAENLGADQIIVVYGHGGDQVRQAMKNDRLLWVEQKQTAGTGHAVRQAAPYFSAKNDEKILILYGDVPLVREQTLRALLAAQQQASMAILTTLLDHPSGYGRIVRNADQEVQKIVEEKEADKATRQIREINTGILCALSPGLIHWLDNINNDNRQNEYYLTDCVGLAVKDGHSVVAVVCQHPGEVMGVNDRIDLAAMENVYQQRQRQTLLASGATLRNPDTLYVEGSATIGCDIVIEPNVFLKGRVSLGDDVKIGMNSVIINSQIGAGTEICANTIIEDSCIGEHCQIGPFARVRPQTQLAARVSLGNFVEVKKIIDCNRH